MNDKNRFSYFSNTDCQYYPCHKNTDAENFNCLFCYCPLYALDDKCGGNFSYTEKGVKDCSACLIPHSAGGYDYVTGRFQKIVELMKENRKQNIGGK